MGKEVYVCVCVGRGGGFRVFHVLVFVLAGKSRWLENPVILCPEMGEGNRPTLDQFLQEFDVVFVDVTGYLNLSMGMTKALYNRVS